MTTELMFILDRSGSMAGLESDTIGGFNGFIEDQLKQEGSVRLTTILFDHVITLLHDRLDLKAVNKLNRDDYFVIGSTALYDAIGFGIEKINAVQKSTQKDFKANKVICVITTDGMENASQKYKVMDIKKLIEAQKEMGWEFVFLGANMDAVEIADDLGINQNRAVTFNNDSEGINLNYKILSKNITKLRSDEEVLNDWKREIEEDFKKRGGKH